MDQGGPVLVEGPVEVDLGEGRTAVSDRFVVALCACRRSRSYPWCDTSHRRRPHQRRDGDRPEQPPEGDRTERSREDAREERRADDQAGQEHPSEDTPGQQREDCRGNDACGRGHSGGTRPDRSP